MKTAWGTCHDLAACIVLKQVGLGFSSLASRLAEARWCVVHLVSSWRLRRGQIEDGQVNATGCIGHFYLKIIVSIVLDHMSIVVI
jgi:hypothetical protein